MTRKALSLVEILLATALVGFAILTMVGVYIGGLRSMAAGRDYTAAVDLAEAVLESTKDLGYEAIPPVSTFNGKVPTAAVGGFPPSPYPKSTVNRQEYFLTVKTSTRDVNLRSVTVQVSWGTGHTTQLQRLFAP